ncbi:MAG: hypothetical protein DRR19_12655 [Candidatus Parabeggiatoa sp. nov. 1]|nr:MAG: hypothetical protein DRR19_12655 [Gammaproteobacteria bacterium]
MGVVVLKQKLCAKFWHPSFIPKRATTRKGQPQGIAPTIWNGHVGAILYGCPKFSRFNFFVL